MQIDFQDIYNQYSKLHPNPVANGVHDQIKFILFKLATGECQLLPTSVVQALRDVAQPDVITEEQAMQQEQLIDKFAIALASGWLAGGYHNRLTTTREVARFSYGQALAMIEVRKEYVK